MAVAASSVQYHFFWNTRSPLSQWHPSNFYEGGIWYNSAEQYMMAEKARIFGDEAKRKEILKANTTRKMKICGREVANFDGEKWCAEREAVVERGSMLKFEQNPEMLKNLLDTAPKVLVDASPYDRIWGIGLRESQAKRTPVEEWPGQNLLGKVLMRVRDQLLAKAAEAAAQA